MYNHWVVGYRRWVHIVKSGACVYGANSWLSTSVSLGATIWIVLSYKITGGAYLMGFRIGTQCFSDCGIRMVLAHIRLMELTVYATRF